jgi:predicted transcriptional regulator
VSHPFDKFEITSETEFAVSAGEITPQERDWLARNNLLTILSHQNNTGEVNKVQIDIEELARVAYEFELLDEVASSVQTDILDVFRRSSDNKLTTSEITDKIDRPKSSVSRSLSRLVEHGKLRKVQSGVYRRA